MSHKFCCAKLAGSKTQNSTWRLRFIKSESEEELMSIAEKNPELKRPVQVVLKLSEDEEMRDLAERRRIFQMDMASNIKGAFRDGEEKGIQKGRREGKAEGKKEEKLESARKMKLWGDSAEKINAITGLSVEEIEKL
jgi:predicted transposase/invertase (TIGR01784 family)